MAAIQVHGVYGHLGYSMLIVYLYYPTTCVGCKMVGLVQ